jgi:hypothetical protein
LLQIGPSEGCDSQRAKDIRAEIEQLPDNHVAPPCLGALWWRSLFCQASKHRALAHEVVVKATPSDQPLPLRGTM